MASARTAPAPRAFGPDRAALCLDLANTVEDRPRGALEHLFGYADLLSWSRQAGTLSPGEAHRLRLQAADTPVRAKAAFRRAIALRERLYRIFSAVARGRRPASADLDSLNRAVAQAHRRLRLTAGRHGIRWEWLRDRCDLDGMLWPVARSAASLLTSAECRRIRECASGTCSWLFVDRSRTHRRRWCSMSTCGNRAKARRFYERKRAAARG